MTEKKFSKTYERPQAEVIDICPETVLCGSDGVSGGTQEGYTEGNGGSWN